jgi:hypothetical protein
MRSRFVRFAARHRAVAAASVALVFITAGTALAAAPGDPLKLGVVNTINAATTWSGAATSRLLSISNTSTAAGARALSLLSKAAASTLYVQNTGTGPGVQISVAAGKPPLTVNGAAGKATNLNADKLDGLDESVFLRGNVLTVSHSTSLSTGSSDVVWFSTSIVQPAGHVLLSTVAGTLTATMPATCGGAGSGQVEVRIDGRAAAFGGVSGPAGPVSARLYQASYEISYEAPPVDQGRNVEVLIRDYCSTGENIVFESLKLNFVLAG